MLYEVVGIQLLKTKENKEFKILHTLSDFSKRDLSNNALGRVAKQVSLFGDFSDFDVSVGDIIDVQYDSTGYIYDVNHF